jgi:hypothetical protein
LVGTIPSEVGYLSDLEVFDMGWNRLSGSIPWWDALPVPLGDIIVIANILLEGTIGTEVGRLPSLQLLQLGYNSFSGSLPSELGLLTGLALFGAEFSSLTGEIPSQLFHLPTLGHLGLGSNFLSGSLPEATSGSSSGIDTLLAPESLLSGSLPTTLDSLVPNLDREDCDVGVINFLLRQDPSRLL